MYAIFKDGNYHECRGNVRFSDTVFQSAETLTEEQRAEFSVFEVLEVSTELSPGQKRGEGYTLTIEGGKIVKKYPAEEMTEEEKQDVIDAKIEQLWKAADSYVFNSISGAAFTLLAVGVTRGLPKSKAVSAWISSVWGEYYRRKSAICFDSGLDLDFSSMGKMPHSVPELIAEVGP